MAEDERRTSTLASAQAMLMQVRAAPLTSSTLAAPD